MTKLDEAYYRKKLSEEQYRVLRDNGDEIPGTGALLDLDGKGLYRCAACEKAVFSDRNRQKNKSGWLSFSAPITKDRIAVQAEEKDVDERGENVRCKSCHSHLGHRYSKQEAVSGYRYQINSVALEFVSTEETKVVSGEQQINKIPEEESSLVFEVKQDDAGQPKSIANAIVSLEKPKTEVYHRRFTTRVMLPALVIGILMVAISAFFAGAFTIKPDDINVDSLTDTFKVNAPHPDQSGETKQDQRSEALNDLADELDAGSVEELLYGSDAD